MERPAVPVKYRVAVVLVEKCLDCPFYACNADPISHRTIDQECTAPGSPVVFAPYFDAIESSIPVDCNLVNYVMNETTINL